MTLRLDRGRSRHWLLLGLGLIATLLLLQGVLGSLLERGTHLRAQSFAHNALNSLEHLSRIVHNVDKKRIELARHVFVEESGLNSQAALDRLDDQMTVVDAELEQATRAYAPLVRLPGEAEVWSQTQLLLGRFQQGTSEVMELARKRHDDPARARMSASLRDYSDLVGNLDELVALNRREAAVALDQLTSLQTNTVRLQWGIRIAGLFAILLLGWWGTRRIAGYEADLTRYARELEARNRDLDAFAGRVAHDLKNALEPIVLSPSLLRAAAGEPNRVIQIADRLERCSRKTSAVIDALLAFSQAAGGAEPVESAALEPVVSSVIEDLLPLATQLDVALEVEHLPDVEVRCTPGLLHIVLANLCGNAVKHLEGRGERRVRIAAYEDHHFCRIEVTDTGPGIPKGVQDKIFEPFFRVEGTRAPGKGIGLATVHRIVEARGGRIAVESAEGQGSRFIVWLPIAPTIEGHLLRRAASTKARPTSAAAVAQVSGNHRAR